MDYEQEDETQDEGVMQRIKESPRTVSALIIILIVAAAIYAFSGDTNNRNGNTDEALLTQSSPTPVVTVVVDASMVPTPVASAAPSQQIASPSPMTPKSVMPEATVMTAVTAEELAAQVAALPAGERTATEFVEKAQAGDSVTKLARRATTRWLIENSSGYAVTNEHRIYVEDYIKDQIGSHGLGIDQTQTVSSDLIKEAVASASQLSDRQLHNLSKYTGRVRF